MARHPARRRFAWLGVGALAALVVASSAPTWAAPAGPPKLDIDLQNVTVAPNSGGQSQYVVVSSDSADDAQFTGVSVAIDTSGLAGIATATPEFPDHCQTVGTVTTCTVHDQVVTTGGVGLFPLNVRALPDARIGQKGTLKLTVSATGTPAASHVSTVAIGEGVDLTNIGEDTTITTRPGGTVRHLPSVRNSGTTAVREAALWIGHDYAAVFAKRYANCRYTEHRGAFCVFPGELAPGREYTLSEPLAFDVRPDTFAPSAIGIEYDWMASADVEDSMAWWLAAKPAPGDGGQLRLVPVVKVQASAAQTDVNPGDNWGHVYVDVEGDHNTDFAAVGATLHGEAGSTVVAKLGATNRGPATVDRSRAGDAAVFAVITVPAGTTAVAAPRSCVPLAGDEPDWRHPGAPGASAYQCVTDPLVTVSETVTWEFSLRIDSRREGATGTVELLGPPAREPDLDPSNDTAKIVVNPTAGAAGGVGSGPSLPVTGADTAPYAGAGIALVALGGVGYLVARRRRTRFDA
jgi:LPXTG-motif cell wall-anchored protein